MINFYAYMYYRLREWQLKKFPRGEELAAVALIALMIFWNMMDLYYIIGIFGFYHLDLIDSILNHKILFSIFFMGLFVTLGRLLTNEMRYIKIKNKFCHETQKQKTIRCFLLWIYVIISIVIIFPLIDLYKYLHGV